jgi:hypothetical protein
VWRSGAGLCLSLTLLPNSGTQSHAFDPRPRRRAAAAAGPLRPWGPAPMLLKRACRRSLFDLNLSVSIAVDSLRNAQSRHGTTSAATLAKSAKRHGARPFPISFAPALKLPSAGASLHTAGVQCPALSTFLCSPCYMSRGPALALMRQAPSARLMTSIVLWLKVW